MNRLIVFFMFATLISCASKKKIIDNNLMKQANNWAQQFIIADGHVDLPYRMKVKNFRMDKEFVGIPISSKDGDFDFKRAKKGGLDAPFMSIFIPADKDTEDSKKLADTLINMVTWIADQNSAYFAIAKTPGDVRRIVAGGKIALPMGMENGSPISALDDVAYYRKKGISYVTLTHSKDNLICDSSYDTTHTHNGLSAFGYTVIEKMQRVGIMIDISHVSDSAFFDVINVVHVPVIASHSSARKFTPGFERNMSDDMIVALGKNGGVIMINFGSTFLDGEIQKIRNQHREMLAKIYEEKGLKEDSKEAEKIRDKFSKTHKNVYSDVAKVVDHIDHVVKLVGIDHVGFGSDFDGVGDSLPTGLKDVADYPNLIYELLKRGYLPQDIKKICSDNVFRVWQQVLDYSSRR